MKNLRTLFTSLLLVALVSCSTPDPVQTENPNNPSNPNNPVTNIVTLKYKEAARSLTTQNLLVEDPRELSANKDIFTWGDLGKISRNEYQLGSYIEYNKVDRTFKFIHPGFLPGQSTEKLISGDYIVQSYYIETGSLVLVLQDDFTSHNLKVKFINQGLSTVNSSPYLIQITGVYSYISPNTNSYFNKNFSLTFHTKEAFSINQDNIIIN
jgi:hypothetical protein